MTHSCMHAGSHDLLLYQHKARCTLGASSSPFISAGHWLCECICRTQGQIIFISFFRGVGGPWLNRSRLWMHQCEYFCFGTSMQAGAVGSDPRPVPLDSYMGVGGGGGGVTSKGPQRPPHASATAKVGNPVYVKGLPRQEKKKKWLTPQSGICKRCYPPPPPPCRFKSWTSLWATIRSVFALCEETNQK